MRLSQDSNNKLGRDHKKREEKKEEKKTTHTEEN